MKSYTNIEQSKKLAEILPLESADIWWAERYKGQVTKDGQYIVAKEPYYYLSLVNPADTNYSQDTIKAIHCWSLAALLEVLPEYNLQRTDWGGKTEYKIVITVNDNNYASKNYDTPIDACYEMVLKLHERKML